MVDLDAVPTKDLANSIRWGQYRGGPGYHFAGLALIKLARVAGGVSNGGREFTKYERRRLDYLADLAVPYVRRIGRLYEVTGAGWVALMEAAACVTEATEQADAQAAAKVGGAR
jgi:hypothetical protein